MSNLRNAVLRRTTRTDGHHGPPENIALGDIRSGLIIIAILSIALLLALALRCLMF